MSQNGYRSSELDSNHLSRCNMVPFFWLYLDGFCLENFPGLQQVQLESLRCTLKGRPRLKRPIQRRSFLGKHIGRVFSEALECEKKVGVRWFTQLCVCVLFTQVREARRAAVVSRHLRPVGKERKVVSLRRLQGGNGQPASSPQLWTGTKRGEKGCSSSHKDGDMFAVLLISSRQTPFFLAKLCMWGHAAPAYTPPAPFIIFSPRIP
jgi:hypothetical protein